MNSCRLSLPSLDESSSSKHLQISSTAFCLRAPRGVRELFTRVYGARLLVSVACARRRLQTRALAHPSHAEVKHAQNINLPTRATHAARAARGRTTVIAVADTLADARKFGQLEKALGFW